MDYRDVIENDEGTAVAQTHPNVNVPPRVILPETGEHIDFLPSPVKAHGVAHTCGVCFATVACFAATQWSPDTNPWLNAMNHTLWHSKKGDLR